MGIESLLGSVRRGDFFVSASSKQDEYGEGQ